MGQTKWWKIEQDSYGSLFILFQAPWSSTEREIEGITWPRGDTKFIFECQKSEIYFNTRTEVLYLQ